MTPHARTRSPESTATLLGTALLGTALLGTPAFAEGPPARPPETAPRVAQVPGAYPAPAYPAPGYPASAYPAPTTVGPAYPGPAYSSYPSGGYVPGTTPGGSNVAGGGVVGAEVGAPVGPVGGVGMGPAGVGALSAADESAQRAETVLKEIMAIPNASIPAGLLASAEAVAIIPNVIKVGFVLGGRHGRGVVLVKQADGSWSLPQFVVITGGSLGWQIGAQSTDVILVFRTPQSVQGLLRGKFTIGADAAVAAGPVGRQAQAATDLELRAEILSYSRSRGLFAGVSLDGSSLRMDYKAQEEYYGRGPDGRAARIPASADALVKFISQYSKPAAGAVAGQPIAGQPAASGPATEPLVSAAEKLAPLLDPQWKTYLELPPELLRPAPGAAVRQPSREALSAALAHYRAVAENPQYQQLNSRPEFQATYKALQKYIQDTEAAAKSGELNLPPPPTGGASLPAVPSSSRR